MRMHHLVFVTIALTACAHNAPSVPSPVSQLSSLEYDLYAVVIKKQNTDIFTPDSTTPVKCQAGVRWDPCQREGPGPDPEAWTAFVAVNKAAMAIDSAELARRGIRMVGRPTDAARNVCPPGPALVDLSRAGFNHDSTEAVLRSGFAAGPGPFEECGYNGGETSLYRREPGGAWKWVDFFSMTISQLRDRPRPNQRLQLTRSLRAQALSALAAETQFR